MTQTEMKRAEKKRGNYYLSTFDNNEETEVKVLLIGSTKTGPKTIILLLICVKL